MEGWREIISLLDRHPSLCVALASLISVLVAGCFSIGTAIFLRRSEESRLRSDIAVRIGVESYKNALEFSKSLPNALKILPVEYFVLCSVKLAELLSMKNITTEIAKIKMEECIKFTQEIQKTLEKNQPTTGSTRP